MYSLVAYTRRTHTRTRSSLGKTKVLHRLHNACVSIRRHTSAYVKKRAKDYIKKKYLAPEALIGGEVLFFFVLATLAVAGCSDSKYLR